MLKRSTFLICLTILATGCSSQQRKVETKSQQVEPQSGQKTPESREKATPPPTRLKEPRSESKAKPVTCLTDGKKAEARKETLKALAIYKKGCEKDNVAACCFAQGYLYDEESYKFDKPDYRKSVNPLKRACTLKYYKGCTEAGRILMGKAEETRTSAVEDGVEAGEGGADLSPEVVKLKKEALVLLKLACSKNEGKGCYYVAKLYEESKDVGGMENEALSKKYKKKACSLNYKKACK